jgi:hypothetical protein
MSSVTKFLKHYIREDEVSMKTPGKLI